MAEAASTKNRAYCADRFEEIATVLKANGYHESEVIYGMLYVVASQSAFVVMDRRPDIDMKKLNELSTDLYAKMGDCVKEFMTEHIVHEGRN